MAMKQCLLRTTASPEPVQAFARSDRPKWLGALYAIQGGGGEASLEDLIVDPVAEAAMRADGVHPAEVIALFERLRRSREDGKV